ncbi:MAG TPA: agmatine deiminase family protein [Chitinophagaceae bacterium]|nr:agmatine deiminase family protein [Chitinophagaceae bacterium]
MKPLNHYLFLLTLAILFSCNQEIKNEFYLPAEWESQTGVIVGGLDDNASFEMIVQLSKETQVYCTVIDSLKDTYRNKLTNAGANLDSIQLIPSSTDFSYADRDGIIFMKNRNGQKQIIKFEWNCYGWYFEPDYKNTLEPDKKKRKLYTGLYINTFKYPVISSSMVNEGGAIETNGKGTILQVESVNMHRNPGMTKDAQEAELKKVLNAKKIIWLKKGAAEDPFGWGTLITKNYFGVGVKGHLDQFCRFVNENTILISFPDSIEAEQDPVKKITLERMKVNYEILKNATDQDGNPFIIIKMPVPDVDYMTFALDTANKNDEIKFLSQQILAEQKNFSIGDTVHFVPSSSYLNFLITNKTVFEAKYWTEGKSETSKAKDEKVKQILKQYFPDKNIYQINTAETNHNGGGLHCWSMQVPE